MTFTAASVDYPSLETRCLENRINNEFRSNGGCSVQQIRFDFDGGRFTIGRLLVVVLRTGTLLFTY
jgi:hypothetical protein